MNKLIIMATFFGALTVHAIETDKMAHLSTAFALTTISYGFIHKTLGAPRLASSIFSAGIVGFGCMFKEGMIDNKSDDADMLYNVLGIGLSVGTMLIFKF